MKKKSSIKSASEKNTKSKKKNEVKKVVKKTKGAEKAKAVTRLHAEKTTAETKRKKVSAKDLVLKKFNTWKPEKVFMAESDEKYMENFTAPPFVSGKNKKETSRIGKLLFRKFDLATIKAAAEKAAAEKAAAEKAAEEKIAAEKAVAEKVAAAEKAAAEKAAAEKAAAERRVAEKAAAERRAIKKAAEEKAAEERRVAEKAAAERRRVAAEEAVAKKAAAEKAAEEKAAAEKAAAEKVAAEKAAAEKAAKIAARMVKLKVISLVACFVLLVALVIKVSSLNTEKYYIKAVDGAVEIRQGKFAPMGEELFIILPGTQSPEPAKAVYSREEVFPLVFNYYIDMADALLDVPGMPDFEGIRSYLNKSLSFVTTNDPGASAYVRLNSIDLMLFLYKADVAASKGTISDLKNAKRYLKKASRLKLDDSQSEMIKQKIKLIDELKAALETKQIEVSEDVPQETTGDQTIQTMNDEAKQIEDESSTDLPPAE